jgi:glycosyltransferase involved in cell wall biosynthesis
MRWLARRPDVQGVHFQEWVPWLAAPMFRRLRQTGKKVYFTVHNVVPHKGIPFVPKKLMDRWIRRGCRQCDCLYVHTDALKDQLSEFLGEGHPPIQVVPHGVWTVRDSTARPSLAKRLSWKRLLFFGIIRENKGLELLLSAAEQLPGYSITIAGEPTDQTYFKNIVMPHVRRLRELGRDVDVRPSFTPDGQLPALFASHTAIALPYTKNFVAQSGVVFMALAYEIPVVASEAGGLRDLFEQYKIGTTFTQDTPDALAAAIRELCEGETPLHMLEEIRAARRHFSWGDAAAATVAGYRLEQQHTQQTVRTYDRAIETSPAH